MQIYSIEFDQLPEHIKDTILTEEYFDFAFSLHEKYNLSDEQDKTLLLVIADLYAKKIVPTKVSQEIQKRLVCDETLARKLEKEMYINIVLPFGDYFGDYREYFIKLGGTQEDIEASKVFQALAKRLIEIAKQKLKAVETVDYEKEAANVKHIFREELVEYLYPPDDDYKVALNQLIFELLARFDNYHTELLNALLENQETIGIEKIVREGARFEPTVVEWIRDILATSGPDGISSLAIAKYITQNPTAKKLSDKEREGLRRLFETFNTLKNFPDSLSKLDRSQWMIIPYRLEEEGEQGRGRATAVILSEVKNPVVSEKDGIATVASLPRNDIATPLLSALSRTDVSLPIASQPMPTIDYNAKADEVIKASDLELIDESLLSRLRTILVTRLRNVRNDTQVRLRLMDPVSEGGVGLTEEQVEKILKQIIGLSSQVSEEKQETKQAIEVEQVLVVSAPVSLPVVASVQPKSQEEPKPVEEKSKAMPQEEKKPAPLPPMAIQEVDGVPTIVEQGQGDRAKGVEEPKKEDISIQSKPLSAPSIPQGAKQIPVQVKAAPVGKVSMSDVKAPPRLMDAVEELRFMTLKDFRRLSQKPEEATQKIMQKIGLLEKESYTKKMAGIQAWKENEISKLYLQIGQESFGKGATMETAIEQRKVANQPYLTPEEFDALLELNEKLRA